LNVDADARTIWADSIARNTAFALATQLTSAAFTAIITFYLVRALGPSSYGVFALAVGVGALVLIASDFGITQSAERFIAEHRGDRAGVAGVLADALKLKLVTASALCALLFALADPIAHGYGNSHLAWPLRAAAIAAFGQTTMFLYRGAFVALGRVSASWRVTTLESAIETCATVLFVVAGAGAAGAAWGRATGYVFGGLIGAYFAVRLIGRSSIAPRGERPGRKRQIAGYAGALFLINAAFTIFEQIDVLLIGAIISTAAVGVFEAPMRVTIFLGYGGQAVAFGVAPRLAGGPRGRANVAAFETSLRYLILVQAALLAPVLVWSRPIVDLALGGGYGQSAEVLRALAPFMFMSALGTFITLTVNYLGEARRRVPLAIGVVLVNLIVDAVLIPDVGVVGGAIGTDVAFALYVIGHLAICKRLLGYSLESVLATLGRSLVASAAMAAVLAAIGTSGLSALELVAGAAGGIAAYATTLIVTRELSRAELAALPRTLSGLLKRSP
jgi:O-antigen/teichoic acid export membrane protein